MPDPHETHQVPSPRTPAARAVRVVAAQLAARSSTWGRLASPGPLATGHPGATGFDAGPPPAIPADAGGATFEAAPPPTPGSDLGTGDGGPAAGHAAPPSIEVPAGAVAVPDPAAIAPVATGGDDGPTRAAARSVAGEPAPLVASPAIGTVLGPGAATLAAEGRPADFPNGEEADEASPPPPMVPGHLPAPLAGLAMMADPVVGDVAGAGLAGESSFGRDEDGPASFAPRDGGEGSATDLSRTNELLGQILDALRARRASGAPALPEGLASVHAERT